MTSWNAISPPSGKSRSFEDEYFARLEPLIELSKLYESPGEASKAQDDKQPRSERPMKA